MEIYIVTAGEYSSYHIIATFLDKDKAQRLKDFIAHSEIEIFEVDPDFVTPTQPYFYVQMERHGNTISCKEEGLITTIIKLKNLNTTWEVSNPIGNRHGRLICKCFAKDREHAIKITNEIRLQLLATNSWVHGLTNREKKIVGTMGHTIKE